MNNGGLSAADVAAVTGNENRGGFFGGDGSWFLIILFLFAILGWGGNGWGGGGGFGGGNGGGFLGAELQRGFDQQSVIRKLDAQTYGMADSTFALNNTITNGFHNTTVGMMQGFNDLGRQLSECCCENRAAIADLKYTMATEGCATRSAMQMNTRDIIDNANANSRAILDFLTENKIESLRAENAALRQNQFIVQVGNDIVNRLNPPAVPSYVVPNPNCCYNANVTLANACAPGCC